MTTPPAAPAERAPSVWEDLLEIFYAPGAVFERRRETPAFGLALLVLVVAMIGLAFAFRGLMEPVFDAEYARGMAQAMKQNPNLTPEMMEQGKQFARKFVYVGVAFYALVGPMIVGIVLWLAGKLVGASAQIGQTTMAAVYAFYPRLLEGIINAVQGLVVAPESITSRYSLSFGVGRFLDPETTSPALFAFLGRVDLFTLWVTAIMAIGLSVMGRIPLAKAAIAAAVVWLVGGLPAIVQGLRAG